LDERAHRVALVDPLGIARIYRGELLRVGDRGVVEGREVGLVATRESRHLLAQATSAGDPAERLVELLGLTQGRLRRSGSATARRYGKQDDGEREVARGGHVSASRELPPSSAAPAVHQAM